MELTPPRRTVPVVVPREGRHFGVRPHGRSILEAVAGLPARFRFKVVDGDGRALPVHGRTARFVIVVGGDIYGEWPAKASTAHRGVLEVEIGAPDTATLPPGSHSWFVELQDPEFGSMRMRADGGPIAHGELRILRDPVNPPERSVQFDSFTPLSVDYDPKVIRWYSSAVPGPATLALPTGIFTVAFRFEAFWGTIGVDVDVSLEPDSGSPGSWTTIGPRFDGQPLEMTDRTGVDAWTIEADARWVRLWWQPSTTAPEPGTVSRAWITV